MKRTLIVALAIAQAVFVTNIHCEKCAEKVMENISFEKGVKDLDVDVESKKVTVTFNTDRTDTVALRKAINRLGYTASVVEYKTVKK
ncbi:MAG: heavy-metal-associated domain-containing protein [Bacteroidales bacterium]|nr:heavy-metal-associated domain-containing protein [Bacteroidales bacterium]